jgi:hypothetical protein
VNFIGVGLLKVKRRLVRKTTARSDENGRCTGRLNSCLLEADH